MHKFRPILATLLIGLTPLAVSAQTSTFYQVDARATYLRTNSDAPAPPTVIFLDALGGQVINLLPSGVYSVAGPTQPAHFWSLFSSSNVLLPDNGVLNRVQGAIDAPAGLIAAVSGPTFIGNVPTDITQDFFIPDAGLSVVVPVGAQYLFVGIPDGFFADNSSPFPTQLGLTVTTSATPEPASIALFATGLAGLGLARRRKRRA